jgi:hypothetical protein
MAKGFREEDLEKQAAQSCRQEDKKLEGNGIAAERFRPPKTEFKMSNRAMGKGALNYRSG